jgi:hypothetical protein
MKGHRSPPEERADSSAIAMDPDDVFSIISNSRRRQVILSVDRSAHPTTADDLAQEIAAIENRSDPCHVTGKQRTRVYIPLTQSHLDKLDDAGAIEYDPRSKQVESSPATSALAKHIRTIQTACYQPDEESQHRGEDV